MEVPGIEPLAATLGEDAPCFRGTITVANRKPIRHLVAISAELARHIRGLIQEAGEQILCDNDWTGRAGVGYGKISRLNCLESFSICLKRAARS